MAHASSREKAEGQMKNYRKIRAKRKLEFMRKTEEEREELIQERHNYSYREIIQTAKWDVDHRQFPRSKRNYLLGVIDNRLREELTDKEREEILAFKKKVEDY